MFQFIDFLIYKLDSKAITKAGVEVAEAEDPVEAKAEITGTVTRKPIRERLNLHRMLAIQEEAMLHLIP